MMRFAVLLLAAGWASGPATPALAQNVLQRATVPPDAARSIAGADAERGRAIVMDIGCNACHVISRVPGPFGRVGPALDGLSHRAYIAGTLPNTPGALVSWLTDPPRHAPRSAMPNMGLTQAQAIDIAAFLYTLPPR